MTDSSNSKKTRRHSRKLVVRRWVQIGFFVLIALISVNHTLDETGQAIPVLSSASLHALCPFGGVVSIYTYITDAAFVKKIHESAFILMGIVFVLTVLFGPVFCGWVCPFGTFQEWLGRIGRKLWKKRYNKFVLPGLDRVLRYLRYAVLAWVIIMTARTAQLVFLEVDPYFALFNFWTGEVALSGFIVLGVVIVLSLFVERPFCKYACPYGAALGLFNLFRVFSIRRNRNTCINCKLCDRNCPMNIPLSTAGTVRDPQCISCLQCTSESACPVKGTMELMVGQYTVLPASSPPDGKGG
ncbi:MAG: 4Fe-4S binding protein [Spirochaetales bacterium]|nr:4Fe-4S binding protein [Spirochaetales bacterium]MCF7938685.1 4Fe-4S binding protein [Spirochaetales bacterium]